MKFDIHLQYQRLGRKFANCEKAYCTNAVPHEKYKEKTLDFMGLHYFLNVLKYIPKRYFMQLAT